MEETSYLSSSKKVLHPEVEPRILHLFVDWIHNNDKYLEFVRMWLMKSEVLYTYKVKYVNILSFHAITAC